MTGEKKIVGLWRETATKSETSGDAVEQAATAEALPAAGSPMPETLPEPVAEDGAERDWLDMTALETTDGEDVENDTPGGIARIIPALLLLAAAAWTGFAVYVATEGFARAPTLGEWPPLVATIAMPLALVLLLWMAILRSGKSEQARFARVAAQLRAENVALNSSMAALGRNLAEARAQLAEQARSVEELGAGTIARMNESGDKLVTNASVIANAYDQLSSAGDMATQRMDGLLAGLPKIDSVVQRLATNFREAGLAAHQQGAALEAQLAALSEAAGHSAQTSESSATALRETIATLKSESLDTCASLTAASKDMTSAHEAAVARLNESSAAARDYVATTAASMETQIADILQQLREGVQSASDHLGERLETAREAGEAIGAQITAHGDAGEALAQRMAEHAGRVEEDLEKLNASVMASTGVIGRSIDDTKGQLAAFMEQVQGGNASAHELITHAESLLLALDAVTRELDESLPRALDRMAGHGRTTQSTLAQMKPMLEESEMVAQSTLSHVNAVKSALAATESQMTGQAEKQEKLASSMASALADAEAALEKLQSGADAFANEGGAQMIATLEQVRTTAESAANDARRTIEKLLSEAQDRLQASATDAIDASFKTQVMDQLGAIEEASRRAVDAADDAANRLTQQLQTILDTSASVEQRAREADQALAATDHDTLAKQAGLLTEALKSTAIDITKILSSEVSDAAWDAYLKGDRGVFARRAVKLIEAGEAKEILRTYQNDDGFHAAVNQFVHDFEAMLRMLIGARDGSAISVTLLSSDIGKLYVALAQAIDRLRG
ncbi:hypothetical protein JI743_01525 [Sphingopyxis sp. DHUNG17]|uniref:hypothetical protein n=1 Tax=Sphingopyxis jiangsuensis TaxID=2871171 RepID=UPI00191D395C|nr:hypothetical protein [Sphingopyxis lutea]MBL0767481.1 hypothetical protein [Sphingopyxis lutea]